MSSLKSLNGAPSSKLGPYCGPLAAQFADLDEKIKTLQEKTDLVCGKSLAKAEPTTRPALDSTRIPSHEEITQQIDELKQKIDLLAFKVFGMPLKSSVVPPPAAAPTSLPQHESVSPSSTPQTTTPSYSSPIFPTPGSPHDHFSTYLAIAGLGYLFNSPNPSNNNPKRLLNSGPTQSPISKLWVNAKPSSRPLQGSLTAQLPAADQLTIQSTDSLLKTSASSASSIEPTHLPPSPLFSSENNNAPSTMLPLLKKTSTGQPPPSATEPAKASLRILSALKSLIPGTTPSQLFQPNLSGALPPPPQSSTLPLPPSDYTYPTLTIILPRGISNPTGSQCFLNSVLQLIIHSEILRDVFPPPPKGKKVDHSPLCDFIENYAAPSVFSLSLPVSSTQLRSNYIAQGVDYTHLALGQQDPHEVFTRLFTNKSMNKNALIFNTTNDSRNVLEEDVPMLTIPFVPPLTDAEIKEKKNYFEKCLGAVCNDNHRTLQFTKIPEALLFRYVREGWCTKIVSPGGHVFFKSSNPELMNKITAIANPNCTAYARENDTFYVAHSESMIFLKIQKLGDDNYNVEEILEQTFNEKVDTKIRDGFPATLEFGEREEELSTTFRLPKGSILGVTKEIEHEITAFIYRPYGTTRREFNRETRVTGLSITGHYVACVRKWNPDSQVHEWWNFDDEFVRCLSENDVKTYLRKAAVILTQRIPKSDSLLPAVPKPKDKDDEEEQLRRAIEQSNQMTSKTSTQSTEEEDPVIQRLLAQTQKEYDEAEAKKKNLPSKDLSDSLTDLNILKAIQESKKEESKKSTPMQLYKIKTDDEEDFSKIIAFTVQQDKQDAQTKISNAAITSTQSEEEDALMKQAIALSLQEAKEKKAAQEEEDRRLAVQMALGQK